MKYSLTGLFLALALVSCAVSAHAGQLDNPNPTITPDSLSLCR